MINDFKDCKDVSTIFNITYCEENSVPHIVFNNIECIFRKSGIFSYLLFCKSEKNKKMVDNYVNIIDQIKVEFGVVLEMNIGIKYLYWSVIS